MKDTITLLIRIAGLVLVIYTISKAPVHSMAYTIRPEYGLVSYLLPSLIPIFAGLIMFMFPATIGSNLAKVAPEVISVEDPKKVVQIGCIVLGVIFLFFSISDIAYYAISALTLWLSNNYELSSLTFDYPGLVSTVIEFVCSLFLIFKSRLIISRIHI